MRRARPLDSSSRRHLWRAPLVVVALIGVTARCGGGQSSTATTSSDAAGGTTGGTSTDPSNANASTDQTSNVSSSTISANAVRESGPTAVLGKGLTIAAMQGCTPSDYYATFVVGGQKLGLLVDSGSTSLAVASSSCSSCGTADSYSGSADKKLGKATQTTYGDGTGWSGVTYQDTVVAGDANSTSAISLKFSAITQQNDFFTSVSCDGTHDIAYDGIIGLGPDALLADNTTSFLTELGKTTWPAHDAFAVQTCGEGGNLYIGGYPASVVTDSPAFAPMLTSGDASSYYAIHMAGTRVGNSNLVSSAGYDAVVDNGTSAILLPTSIYNALVAKLVADANYSANFSRNLIEGVTVEASAQGLTREQVDAALPAFSFSFKQTGGALVTVTLPATYSYLFPIYVGGTLGYTTGVAESGLSFGILGNTAMRKHLVVFDRDNGRIGFAEQDACGDEVMVYQE